MFIYWQMASFEFTRIKNLLEQQAHALSLAPEDQIHWSIKRQIYADLRQVTFSALFDRERRYIEGNIKAIPDSLPIDGMAHQVALRDLDENDQSLEPNLFVAQRLPDSRILLIGRSILDLGKLKEAVLQALQIGVLPMACMAIIVGAVFSRQMNSRLARAQRTLSLFQKGRLDERLPISGRRDELDILSTQVNSLLMELERVVNELHHVGNNMAHNLRTPLARVQASLENAQRLMPESEAAYAFVTRAIQSLEQTFALTTALLRVAQMESGKARGSFCLLDLSELIHEVADLYEPVAEAKGIALEIAVTTAKVRGDRDLLLEALANLLDNAVKFSPEHGSVKISLSQARSGPVISITDTGPGIPDREKSKIFKRFYRGPHSSQIPGNGLGLTLVAAIVRLHNFSLEVEDGPPGSVFRLRCVATPDVANAPSASEPRG
ncbi:two-component sensor histidine kinase [Methylocystis bryophila]|nr:two-component sensor histidine kinase [Methylocystis bryophila]